MNTRAAVLSWASSGQGTEDTGLWGSSPEEHAYGTSHPGLWFITAVSHLFSQTREQLKNGHEDTREMQMSSLFSVWKLHMSHRKTFS